MTINLIDARRGLHDKCLELFADKKIAEQIYRYLCDGIEDCEEVECKHGHWIFTQDETWYAEFQCSECKEGVHNKTKFCPNCGARMDEVEE